jgi:putative endonuclease
MPANFYLLSNKRGGTLYAGSTTDFRRRLCEHRSKAVPGFTRKYKIILLVYLEEHRLLMDARYRERRVKFWRRAWKIALMERENPDWNDLAHRL